LVVSSAGSKIFNNNMEINVHNTETIFSGYFLTPNKLFFHTFGKIPSVVWVNQMNTEKILAFLKGKFESAIQNIHQISEYHHQRKKIIFSETIMILKDECLIYMNDNYCEVFHAESKAVFANDLIKEISQFKETAKRSEFEINIIVQGESGLELKSMEVKKTRLNLPLYYEDDFREVDELIRKRLNTKKDKGIVLLHGLPGTGKTTYLRYLIGKVNKKVIFISPEAARHISSPKFLDLLVDNPESVLVVEDAENIIKDRYRSDDSSVSDLLNLSDGLLADFLNVQIICTFNHSLSTVDEALMRKGRLIAKYEFGKLSVSKAQLLSEHLGFRTSIVQPMTIAEITHPQENDFEGKPIRKIGFQPKIAVN
jgi:hypothetical protein